MDNFHKNPLIVSFLRKLDDAGVTYRINWRSRRDGRIAHGVGGPDVYHLAFCGNGFAPALSTAVIIDYDGDGFGFYPESRSNRIDDDVAAVVGAKDDASDSVDAMMRAEEFIRGFEDDDIQEGIPEILAGLRAAISKATGVPFEIEKQKAKEPTRFDYFEVRPCIEVEGRGSVESFTSEDEFYDAITKLAGAPHKHFWTIYGIESGIATAIGDFSTKAAAHNVMDAIIAPMASARDLIRDGDNVQKPGVTITAAEKAANDLDDFINQCSNADRI